MKKFTRVIEIFLLALTVALCFFAVSCGNGEKDPGDTAETGIGGVDIGGFKDVFDDNGNLIGKEVYYTDGSLRYEEKLNAKGDMTESFAYNKDGTVDVEEKRAYNSDGTIIQITTKKCYYENGQLTEYNISYFDNKFWCTESHSYNADGSSQGFTTYEYDGAGNITKESVFDKNVVLRKVVKREYGDKNNPTLATKEIIEDNLGNVTEIAIMEYHENGTIKKRSECGPDGVVKRYCDYVYGDDGKVSEEQIYISDGNGGFIRYR